MYPVEHPFLNESVKALASLPSPEAAADTCIKLLKSRNINKLSCHEWVDWLDKVKDHLEIALKVSEKGKDVLALLKSELDFRKTDYHLPIITAYGYLAEGKVQEPKIRLVSQQRMEWGLIQRVEKLKLWDENWDVATILQEKNDPTERPFLGNPTDYSARVHNVPAPAVKSLPQTKQDANALVQYLHKLFPWNYDINCEYRALAAKRFVEALGVDPAKLSFVIIGNKSWFGEGTPLSFGKFKWRYHEVLRVETAKDGFFILDPLVDAKEALELEKWQELINGQKCGIAIRSKSDCRDEPAYAAATHNRFPDLERITSEQTHPLLNNLFKNYVGA